jgi:chitinase
MAVLAASAAIFLFAGCSKGEVTPEPTKPTTPTTPTTTVSVDTLVTQMQSKVAGREVGTYCTYYGSGLPNPNYVTYINYAFAEVYVSSNVYNGFKLQGGESRFQSVVDLKKQNPAIKIFISFTNGVANSDNKKDGGFSAISANAAYRKQFAEDCLAFIKKWGIDGIDIDWEFPGLAWGASADKAVDTDNFTLLMKQLRETLGTNYLLSYAGYVKDKVKVTGGYEFMDIAAVMPYVDFVNVMTYDFDSAPSYHNALQDAGSYWDCVRTVNAYKNAGATMSKLHLGIPFYARKAFSGTSAAVSYKNLSKSSAVWSSIASVPYIPDATTKSVTYSYDNTKSIFRKGSWMLGLGLSGMFCWEISQDDASNTLQKAMWNATMR